MKRRRTGVWFAIGALAFSAVLPLSGAVAIPIKEFKVTEFDAEGRLVRRLTADAATGSAAVSDLKGSKIEFFSPGSPDTPTAILTVPQAIYDSATKIIRGDRDLKYTTPEGVVQGRGFEFNTATGVLGLRSNVRFNSPLLTLTGDRATLASDTSRPGNKAILFIEVTGNVVALRGIDGDPKFPERFESAFARYDFGNTLISARAPVRIWRDGKLSLLEADAGEFTYPVARPPPLRGRTIPDAPAPFPKLAN